MKFFADTANLEEIAYCFSHGVNDGITTNPKIIKLSGDLSLGFEEACKIILRKYTSVPVSLETDLGGIPVSEIEERVEDVAKILLKQARQLASWASNVVIKIPICSAGLYAAKILAKEGIKTNITACMTPYQALEAAKSNATYVSLFANRMVDAHILKLSTNNLDLILEDPNWKEIVSKNKEKYLRKAWDMTLEQIAYVAEELDKTNTKLIVGSIRDSEDIMKIVEAGPHIITIPPKIVKDLIGKGHNLYELKKTPKSFIPEDVVIGDSLYFPMTQYTLEEFEKCADSYRKKSRKQFNLKEKNI